MNLLGIDVGTGGSRAVVINENGTIVSAATVEHIPFNSPNIGYGYGKTSPKFGAK
jgi:xylulokinase